MKRYTEFVAKPVSCWKEGNQEVCEVTDHENAHFYSVYGRCNDGTMECIADIYRDHIDETRDIAETIVNALEEFAFADKD